MRRLLDPHYSPQSTDLVVSYRVVPKSDLSFHDCLEHLIESLSIGSIRDHLSSQAFIPHLFDLHQQSSQCKIAFHEKLFEAGNLPQILSIITGGFRRNHQDFELHVESIQWSSGLLAAFRGPSLGLSELRQRTGVVDRPWSCITLYPQSGLPVKALMEKSYHLWMGGCDMVCESAFLAHTLENSFFERVEFLSREARQCEQRSKSMKWYVPNVTAGSLQEMQMRVHKAREVGLQAVRVNALQIGICALDQLARICAEQGLFLMADHDAAEGLVSPVISSAVSGQIIRFMGADMWNISLDTPHEEQKDIVKALKEHQGQASYPAATAPLCGEIERLESIVDLVKAFGNDQLLQGGAAVFLHPDGVKAGAEAFQAVLQAAASGLDFDSAVKGYESVKRSLKNPFMPPTQNLPMEEVSFLTDEL